jgi:guanylate kinase
VSKKPLVLVLHGPAGVGKDSLVNELRKTTDIQRATSSTSRAPREGERDHVDYHFLTEAQFQEEIAAGKFVEHAIVYGEFKGVHTDEVRRHLDAGEDLIIRTDVQGARTWRRKLDGAVYLFLMPGGPAWTHGSLLHVGDQSLVGLASEIEDIRKQLRERLLERGSESGTSLDLRLAEIDEEIADIPNNDYVVVNRKGALGDAVRAMKEIIERERANPERKPARLMV